MKNFAKKIWRKKISFILRTTSEFETSFLAQKNQSFFPEMDYDKFLSTVSANRYNNPIRHLVKLLDSATPDMIPLSAGLPTPALFPFTKATFETLDGQEIILAPVS